MARGAENGIRRDAGDGLTSLTLVRGSAAVQGAAQLTAFQDYLQHPTDCPLCPEHASQCDEAGRLWETYRQLR